MVTHMAQVDGQLAKLAANYLGLRAPDGQDSTKAEKAKGSSQQEGPRIRLRAGK
jgi:hypothetical protein